VRALQTAIELDRGGVTEIVFFLGQADDAAAAQALIERYRATDLTRPSRGRRLLGRPARTLQVTTPDRPMDIM